MSGKWSVALAASMIVCGSAQAAFINGVEDFNGTSVDSSTWVPHYWGDGSATVSGGYLDLAGQYQLATRSLTIGVGTTLSARVMLTAAAPDSGTVLTLGITATPTSPAMGMHLHADLSDYIDGQSVFTLFAGNNYVAYSHGSRVMKDNIGIWYRMVFERTSADDYTCNLLSDAGAPLYSISYSYPGLPDEASIFIGLGPTARFDWVAVPEPITLTSLLCTGLLLTRRSRRV